MMIITHPDVCNWRVNAGWLWSFIVGTELFLLGPSLILLLLHTWTCAIGAWTPVGSGPPL